MFLITCEIKMTLENVKIWLQKKIKSVRIRRHFFELIRPRRSRSPAENMNSSHQIQNEFPGNCVVYIFIGGKPHHLSDLSYVILFALIVIHATTCPFTVVLNLLVMIAVKTKVRLQSMSNMALACLAMTDVMVGLVVEPLFIAQIWNIIQGETTASACSIQIASKLSSFLFCLSSIVHLSLISVDHASLYLSSNRHQTPCTDSHSPCMDPDFNYKHLVAHWRGNGKGYFHCCRIFTYFSCCFLQKLWGGGEFSSRRNFFSLSNSLYEFILGHSMNIF